jgi:glycerol kinase
MKYILALDQGTTSSRALLFNSRGAMAGMAQREFRQIYPQPGWVEHDPEEIWRSQLTCARRVLRAAGAAPRDVAAIGIANQRETTLIWDRTTGQPVHNAIVWQDRRTADLCQRLRRHGAEKLVRGRTGLVLDPYFSATKIAWILDAVPGLRRHAARGELAFGTVDTWLAWKLSGGKLHVTDVSNASRTLLYNIHARDWDDELLALFNIPRSMLPEVRASASRFGTCRSELLGAEILLGGMAGDQQASLFGQACTRPGMAKNTYGTGCFMLLNTGRRALTSKRGLLTTCAADPGGSAANRHYALEGSVFSAGAVVQWLRDGLGLIRRYADIEPLAASVEDTGGVFLVPAFTGLGAPHWDPYARGVIVGLTRGSGRAHIARAALECIALQCADLMAAMQADSGTRLAELRVDGGSTASALLMQMQADLLGVPVVVPKVTETTALGAAFLAGLSSGLWDDMEGLSRRWRAARRYAPRLDPERAAERIERWHEAVQRSRRWEQA